MAEGVITGAVAAVLICLVLAVRDGHRFVTVTYKIRSDKIKKPCRMALLSDLHNMSFGMENEKLLGRIRELSPDVVLVAGDMLTAEKGQGFETALHVMKRLAADYKVYYGLGNHEQKIMLHPEDYPGIYEGYLAGLKEAGLRPLVNESVYLPEWNIAVCGALIDGCFFKRLRKKGMEAGYLTGLLGKPQEGVFRLLIAHNPDYFEDYAKWGADLVVSGHVHGGIMRLPLLGGVLSPNFTLFPKYDGGMFSRGKSTMILSRGLGSHTIPLRFFNPGELVVIELVPDR